MPKKSGFTLIELLVVIAIIGILTVIGYSTYSNIQASARDTKRKADVDAIAKALEDKYNPATGVYSDITALQGTDFTSGTVPTDNGASYYFSKDTPGNIKAFVVCTNTLEKSNQPYCKYSANGTTSQISSLATPAPASTPSSGGSSNTNTNNSLISQTISVSPPTTYWGITVNKANYTAENLCHDLLSIPVNSISIWSQGSWEDHLCTQTDTQASTLITPNAGYAINTSNSGSVVIQGSQTTNSPIPLTAGWNPISFVTVPTSINMASKLFSSLSTNGFSPIAVEVFSEGNWTVCNRSNCGSDFPITPGVGYLVRVGTGGAYNVPAN